MRSRNEATPFLPLDLVTLILLWLPVQSLCRFKCISKEWLRLISSPEFGKRHLYLNRTRKQLTERLLYISKRFDCCSLDLEFSDPSDVQLNFRDEQYSINFFFKIFSSCDGLVLLLDSNIFLILANPSTGELWRLPHSPFHGLFEYDLDRDSYGFGYDSSSDDYKVVRISLDHEVNDETNGNTVSVYSLKFNSWRSIKNPPYRLSFFCPAAFINGALHWVCKSCIAGLNLESECFYTVPLPSRTVIQELHVIDGALCGLEYILSFNDPCNFWIMKEYGVRDSWIKFTFDKSPSRANWIFPSRSGKILIYNGRKLEIYDLQDGALEDRIVPRVPDLSVVLYEESLIRLQG